jgi:hypothetical protein
VLKTLPCWLDRSLGRKGRGIAHKGIGFEAQIL